MVDRAVNGFLNSLNRMLTKNDTRTPARIIIAWYNDVTTLGARVRLPRRLLFPGRYTRRRHRPTFHLAKPK